MKIGILTQPLHNNYGGILQNYALQKVLKNLGHSVCTINLQYNKTPYKKTKLILSIGKRLIKKVSGDKNIIFINPQKQRLFFDKPGFYQKKFIDKNINYITVYKKLDQDFDIQNEFEAYIVGSDQVWRPSMSPFLKNYYLDFVIDKNKIKIAYAASFGVENWEANESITPVLSEYAKKFKEISVREKSGIELCQNYLKVNAIQTLDPTMLLNKQNYLDLVIDEDKDKKTGKNKLAAYILDMDKNKELIIKDICKTLNLQPYFIGRPNKKGFPSIESWINEINKSDFVITDSFHGTVFAIIFEKRFLSIANTNRGECRFTSLLNMINLKSRLVYSYEDYKKKKNILTSAIDYDQINTIIKENRNASIAFLINALNQTEKNESPQSIRDNTCL